MKRKKPRLRPLGELLLRTNLQRNLNSMVLLFNRLADRLHPGT
jgi:hypothetical protein